jgi:hypothetical protein
MQHKQSKIRLWFTLVLSLFFISGCSTTEDEARSQIFDLTDIEIPTEAALVYNYNNDVFVGRVSRYSVFGFEEKPVDFLLEHYFTDTKSKNFEDEYAQDVKSFLYFVSKHVSDGIPEQYLVNWDEDYSWLYHEEDVYFVYSTTSQILIIYIVGH